MAFLGVMRVLEINGKCWCTNPLLGTVRGKARAEFGESCQDFKRGEGDSALIGKKEWIFINNLCLFRAG